MNKLLVQLCIDTLRFLSVDAVQKGSSGQPGMPLGAAPMAYAEFSRQQPASAVAATVRQRRHS